jgi:AbrB family looped-hinge helix DNA binding protein
MATIFERSLIKLGHNGLVVTIPKAFRDYYELEAGDKVKVIATNRRLVIKPIKSAEKSRKEVANQTTEQK